MRAMRVLPIIVGAAVVVSTSGAAEPISAERYAWREWCGYDYDWNWQCTESLTRTDDLFYFNYDWSSGVMPTWLTHQSEINPPGGPGPEGVFASLSASGAGRGGAGEYYYANVRTGLDYAFEVLTPTRWSWSYTISASAPPVGTPDEPRGRARFVLSDSAGHMVLGEKLETACDLFTNLSGTGSGHTLLPPGVYTLEIEAAGDQLVATDLQARGDADASFLSILEAAPVSGLLGPRAVEGEVTIDSFGSDFDTVLALYGNDGSLLAVNDNDGGLQSRITDTLSPGAYFVALGGEGAVFADGFTITPGSSGGQVHLTINGSSLDPVAISAGETLLHAFDVTQPPSATELGLIEPDGDTDIGVVATHWFGGPNQCALYDDVGDMVGAWSFDEHLSISTPLEAGLYTLAIGPGTVTFGSGFAADLDCGDADPCFGCYGEIEFEGTVEGRSFAGGAVGGNDSGAIHVEAAFFRFEIAGAPGCNPADLAEPWGLLDLDDVTAFVTAFMAQDPLADLDGSGVFDLADIVAFVEAFMAGCP
jgi:hypothetical protein